MLPGDDVILVLASAAGEGTGARQAIAAAGMTTSEYASMDALCARLAEGAGAVVLAEEDLVPAATERLAAALAAQPPWSDVPLLVFVGASAARPPVIDNATLLCRPVSDAVLVHAARAALRARRRQYEVREDHAERDRAAALLRERERRLEEAVAERAATAERQAAQLQALARELAHTEHRERQRLAQLLHDQLQQSLVAAKLTVGGLTRRAADTRTRDALETVQRLLQQSIEASRTLALELSPPVLIDGGLLTGLRWLVRWVDERHGLDVELHADGRAEPTQPEVRMLLFQCARELLTNVVRHAGVSRATVRLEVVADDRVALDVCDDGAGFETDALRGRGDDARLGLLGIRDRIQSLGGQVHIDSAPGRGTRVRLLAPRGARPALGAPRAASAAARAWDVPGFSSEAGVVAATETAVAGEPVRVLIADDHEIVRDGLAELLGDVSWIEVVAEAADGLEAVALAHRDHPDVVVMDVTMPRLSGIEATRRIRSELPDVQVVGLSMHDHAEMATALERAGAAAYLTKGGAADDLFRAIRDAAARSRTARATQ